MPEHDLIRIQAVVGTTRDGRFGEIAAGWVIPRLQDLLGSEAIVETVDLRDHPLPFFDGVAPAKAPREYPGPEVERFGRVIDRADAFVILTGEYNHGYPAVLKNAIDWTFAEWRHKPVSFVGWGNVGGARAIEQLRQVAVELEMAPVRHAVHVMPEILMAARQSGVAAFEPLEGKLKLLADELMWWTRTLRDGRHRYG